MRYEEYKQLSLQGRVKTMIMTTSYGGVNTMIMMTRQSTHDKYDDYDDQVE